MAKTGPWGKLQNVDENGAAIDVRRPEDNRLATWAQFGNRDVGAAYIEISWDGGVTYTTQVPAGGFHVAEGRMATVWVRAAPGTTVDVEVTARAGDGE